MKHIIFKLAIPAFLLSTLSYADETNSLPGINRSITDRYKEDLMEILELIRNPECKISAKDRAKYYQKAVEYGQLGMAYMQEAENYAWYIPEVTYQEMTTSMIKGAAAAITQGDPWKVVMSALSSSLGDIAAKIYEQYNDIKLMTLKAEECFDMQEFYLAICKQP